MFFQKILEIAKAGILPAFVFFNEMILWRKSG